MDWKLQNNHEKRRKKRTKPFCRNLLVGNLEKLVKNRQVCLICHINVKINQETGNRQTDKQTALINNHICLPSVRLKNLTKGYSNLVNGSVLHCDLKNGKRKCNKASHNRVSALYLYHGICTSSTLILMHNYSDMYNFC